MLLGKKHDPSQDALYQQVLSIQKKESADYNKLSQVYLWNYSTVLTTVVYNQNVSCISCPFLHRAMKEGGSKEGGSNFDKTLSIW